MSATFAILSAALITIVVCATTCALLMPSERTHRIWAARVAQIRAARAARALVRAQARATRAQATERAAWEEVFKG